MVDAAAHQVLTTDWTQEPELLEEYLHLSLYTRAKYILDFEKPLLQIKQKLSNAQAAPNPQQS